MVQKKKKFPQEFRIMNTQISSYGYAFDVPTVTQPLFPRKQSQQSILRNFKHSNFFGLLYLVWIFHTKCYDYRL